MAFSTAEKKAEEKSLCSEATWKGKNGAIIMILYGI